MWRVYLLLLIVTLIAGVTPIAARMATHELPPLSIPLVRFGTAGVLLALTVKALRLGRPIPRSHWPLFIGLGLLCVPVNQVGFLIGIKKANASHAGIAYALVPVLVYWISVSLGRSSPSVAKFGSSAACSGSRSHAVTLQWGLSDTPLAREESALKAPTEGELFALTVAHLLAEGQTYEGLRSYELVLQRELLRAVAEVFEYRIPELAREFGESDELRQRLVELVGIRVTRSASRHGTPSKSVVKSVVPRSWRLLTRG